MSHLHLTSWIYRQARRRDDDISITCRSGFFRVLMIRIIGPLCNSKQMFEIVVSHTGATSQLLTRSIFSRACILSHLFNGVSSLCRWSCHVACHPTFEPYGPLTTCNCKWSYGSIGWTTKRIEWTESADRVTTKYWRRSCAVGLSSSYHLQFALVLCAYHRQVLRMLSSLRHRRDIVPPLSKGPNPCQNPPIRGVPAFTKKKTLFDLVCEYLQFCKFVRNAY